MSDNIQDLVEGMKKNPKTFIGKGVTVEEAIEILQAAGEFIRHQLLQCYNVSFPGIGIFALSRQQLPISHHPVKYIVSQKPIFQLSHSLAVRFDLKWARIHYEVTLPERELNPSSIAVKCQTERKKVILTMNELVNFVERRLHTKENVELPISSVGVLRIFAEEYKMEFNKQFLQEVTMNDVVHVVQNA